VYLRILNFLRRGVGRNRIVEGNVESVGLAEVGMMPTQCERRPPRVLAAGLQDVFQSDPPQIAGAGRPTRGDQVRLLSQSGTACLEVVACIQHQDPDS
jgi:hypothetical protein